MFRCPSMNCKEPDGNKPQSELALLFHFSFPFFILFENVGPILLDADRWRLGDPPELVSLLFGRLAVSGKIFLATQKNKRRHVADAERLGKTGCVLFAAIQAEKLDGKVFIGGAVKCGEKNRHLVFAVAAPTSG